jgi:hypothetical protein
MFFEVIDETNPKTGAKRVLFYEDDGTIVMLNDKYYEDEDEKIQEILIFGEEDPALDDGPKDE